MILNKQKRARYGILFGMVTLIQNYVLSVVIKRFFFSGLNGKISGLYISGTANERGSGFQGLILAI